MDFNPVPDRLRVVSDTGQSLRINVDTGAVITDTALNPAGLHGGRGCVHQRLRRRGLARRCMTWMRPAISC